MEEKRINQSQANPEKEEKSEGSCPINYQAIMDLW